MPSKHKKERRHGSPPPGGSAERGGGPPGKSGQRGRSWFERNRRDLRFLAIFGTVIVAYYLSTVTAPMKEGFFPAYLRLNAGVSAGILRLLGQDVTVDGQAIIAQTGMSLQIERGCDAVDPSALFIAAVIASPVRVAPKLLAIAGGTIVLMLLNLARVVSLFFVRMHWPQAFDVAHLDVWQALFIFLAILMWGVWASRAARHATAKADG